MQNLPCNIQLFLVFWSHPKPLKTEKIRFAFFWEMKSVSGHLKHRSCCFLIVDSNLSTEVKSKFLQCRFNLVKRFVEAHRKCSVFKRVRTCTRLGAAAAVICMIFRPFML